MPTDIPGTFARGTLTFCGVEFEVSPGVLAPREETELLAGTACSLLAGVPNATVIDMCCGAGNLVSVLALRFPDATFYGSDVTAPCVRLAQRNISRHALGSRVSIHQGNLFESLSGLGLENEVDLVVCNPPYIPKARLETSRRELLDHEPREAFEGGAYGMDVIGKLITEAALFLRPGRSLCFEFGEGQHRMCQWLLDRSGQFEQVRMVENAESVPRVAMAIRKPRAADE